ncbi:hypothetical protein ABPG77_000025 [Micractinium sp. CCAP 211/92]
MRPRRGSTDGMVVRRSTAPRGAQQHQPASSAVFSPWQAPGDVLDPILQLLLASGEDGPRWLRVASHVCSAWRSSALDILLADTAISKPPLEDFRAIGAEPAPAQRLVELKKADTVVTQAAMVAVAEASASTGMEAISKQRFDAPAAALHAAVEGVGGTGRGRSGGRVLRRAMPRLANVRASSVSPELRAAMLAQHVQQQAQQAQQHAQQPLQQGQQPGGGAAAMSPARQQAAAQPQGSVQSDMAAVVNNRRATSESDSDGGSTLAQAGPAKKPQRQRAPGALGTACVEQPQPAVPSAMEYQTQQQQHGNMEAGGQPSDTAQGRKRTGSGGDVRPRKRRQVAAGRHRRGAADEAVSPSRSPAGRGGDAAAPAAPPAQPQEQQEEQLPAREHRYDDSEASGPYYEAEGDMPGERGNASPAQRVEAPSGQRAERRPASAPAAVGGQAPAAPAPRPQRSGAGGRVHAVVDFVKRIVGL